MKEKNDSIKKMLFLLSAGMAVSMFRNYPGMFFHNKAGGSSMEWLALDCLCKCVDGLIGAGFWNTTFTIHF